MFKRVLLCVMACLLVLGTVASAEELTPDAREAYRTALYAALRDNVMPDGTAPGEDQLDEPEGNCFALSDVDGDGRDELLLAYTTCSMAGQAAYVLDYDGQALHIELIEYPLLTFYPNGVVKAGWSHNQGLAGNFWPYNVYAYNADTDTYEQKAMVDAFDRQFASKENPYPQEIDKSDAGIVYLITLGDQPEQTVDAADYQAWAAMWGENSQPLEPTYLPLTEENIDAL